ncbi:MAG: SMP-30/gluconolactonase/LRE family protein [Pseudolysinimonas sp.]
MNPTEPASDRAAEWRVATIESFDLAEGPVWDPIRNRLLWVDIRRGAVLVGELRDDGTISVEDRIQTPEMVGAVAVSQAGDWILAGERGILTRSAAGQSAGQFADGPTILADDSGRRLNDAKVDPAGRFVVGTLKIDEGPTTTERLVVVQPDGALQDLDSDLSLSNGLAWSPDGSVLYSIDTVPRIVYARDYNVTTGTAGPRRVLIALEEGVNPDGMCVDADGRLWIAIWGGGQVRCYSPDGVLTRTIEVPSANTSCVAFAGPDLSTMVITTATKDLGDDELARSPLAGRLFTVDAGVRGLPVTWWSGLPR